MFMWLYMYHTVLRQNVTHADRDSILGVLLQVLYYQLYSNWEALSEGAHRSLTSPQKPSGSQPITVYIDKVTIYLCIAQMPHIVYASTCCRRESDNGKE